MRELTTIEIKQTSGSSGPAGALVGAIGSASAYYGDSISSGDGSWGGLAQAALGGAITGFFLGPAANTGTWSVVSGLIGFYGGLITGGISSFVSSHEN